MTDRNLSCEESRVPDWVKRISSLLIDKNQEESNQIAYFLLQKANQLDIMAGNRHNDFVDLNLSAGCISTDQKITSIRKHTIQEVRMEETQEHSEINDDDNIKALKKLRSMPRGSETNSESRIAAIKNLLGEKEIFKTLQVLRWPKGVVCPRCHSSKVVRRDPPPNAADKRHYYECLSCKGEGSPSDFDDFTGLPVGTLQGLRQWMLCWYLIGFCSMSQIARVLGLSVYEVTQIASFGSNITQISKESKLQKEKMQMKENLSEGKQEIFYKQQDANVRSQEDYTRSASKQPFKPGYKSKK